MKHVNLFDGFAVERGEEVRTGDRVIATTPYLEWLINIFLEKGVDLLGVIGFMPGRSCVYVDALSHDEFACWESTNPDTIDFTFRDDDCTLARIFWDGSFHCLSGFVDDSEECDASDLRNRTQVLIDKLHIS